MAVVSRPAKSSGGRSIKGDEEVRGFTSPRRTGTISLAFPFFFLFIVNNGQERGLDLNWFSDFLKTDFYYLWGWSMLPCLQDTQRQNLFSSSEMEFLDITVTKDSSFFLYTIHCPFY
jgi:hypothetical protein